MSPSPYDSWEDFIDPQPEVFYTFSHVPSMVQIFCALTGILVIGFLIASFRVYTPMHRPTGTPEKERPAG